MTDTHTTPGVGTSVSPSRWLAIGAVVLSFAAGATDAFAFLLLGGVFTANMTGNLVLAGLTERANYSAMVVGVAVAIAAFVVGLFVSFGIARAGARIRRLIIVLASGTVAQAAVLAGWLLVPAPGQMSSQWPLIALSAFAMAAQTAVSRRAEARSGVSTTYVTGTLTSLVADFSDHRAQAWVTRVTVILALVLGALCGSLAIGVSPTLGAALPIIPALVGMIALGIGARATTSPR
ncbi:DUF1275 domain-containing protein [Herbiconiux sp. CPCC 205763]|uniref:DUF1275 domain-containing protein n=1 Tax=Herbiconiux aconitum TaxID=2970913 RepID=A0ABT2GZG8_9MICO|nr:YoaK family protein [Herbiconiux aconitum]MCS5720334.1 DUF1275 domain-containing protein [Herbiconiux aconitum]